MENPGMVELLRESLLSTCSGQFSRKPSKTRSKGTAFNNSDHVTLDGFDDPDADEYWSQIRGRNPSRSYVRDQKAGKGITSVINLADKCVHQLQQISSRLSKITARNDQLAKGEKAFDSSQEFNTLGELAKEIMIISREAFVPAHRLCQSAVGLYLTEDFIRESRDIDCLDYFSDGRVRVPNQNSKIRTLERLQACVDRADKSCRRFQPLLSSPFDRQPLSTQRKTEYEDMQDVLLTMQSSVKNLYATANGCFHLFDLLLYITPEEQVTLAGFLNSLNSMQKSDLLEDISTLRRSVDHIHLLLEKLSWASYTVFRLANGKSVCPSPVSSGIHTPNDETLSQSKKHSNSMVRRKMSAQQAGDEVNSRPTSRNADKFSQKQVVRQARGSTNGNPGTNTASLKPGKSGKANSAVLIQHSASNKKKSKSKSKSKERLQERQRGKNKSKDKKAVKKSKTAVSKKSKYAERAESEE